MSFTRRIGRYYPYCSNRMKVSDTLEIKTLDVVMVPPPWDTNDKFASDAMGIGGFFKLDQTNKTYLNFSSIVGFSEFGNGIIEFCFVVDRVIHSIENSFADPVQYGDGVAHIRGFGFYQPNREGESVMYETSHQFTQV